MDSLLHDSRTNEKLYQMIGPSKFPTLCEAKIKEVIFIGLQIRNFLRDSGYDFAFHDKKKIATEAFKLDATRFLGYKRSEIYQKMVTCFIKAYKCMGRSISLKNHFLNSHLNFFPQNYGVLPRHFLHGEKVQK